MVYPAEYIGDSVYMKFDGDHFLIWIDNGYGPENIIYLEPSVVESFQMYVDKVAEAIKDEKG